jgi:lycopene beta-cyclase
MTTTNTADIVIVGGGLSGCLTAWRLRQLVTGLRLRLIERGARLGGNHTWSFFEPDLTPEQNRWIDPLVAFKWPAYEVRFPNRRRTLTTGYRSITSDRLHEILSLDLAGAITYGASVTDITARHVRLSTGETWHAACVLDARGAQATPGLVLGFQKFLGQEVELAAPHGLAHPIVMDATVSQSDGYRFVYTLPFTPTRLLIEDTYYSDDQTLSAGQSRDRIGGYALAKGWEIERIVREELGVLPIILAGDVDQVLAQDESSAPRIGMAASLFHPTTGYSLPDAVQLADRLAARLAQGVSTPDAATSAAARSVIAGYARQTWRERSYFRLLNRMMFRAGQPNRRYRLLERFYGFDQALIQRFYAGRLTAADRLRIVVGRPPVPILSALGCVSEARMLQQLKDA